MTSTESIHDVAIVGAGLSGLTAARVLDAHGIDVVVLEAHSDVGGRTRNATVAGANVDLGGTFVGPTQDRVHALAQDLGCTTHPTYTEGESLLGWQGTIRRYRGTTPRLGAGTLLNLGRVRLLLGRHTRNLGEDSMGTPQLDTVSFGTWLNSVHAGTHATTLLTAMCRVTWGCEPSEISFLHVLRHVKSAGGFDRLLDTEGGAQQDHFHQGAHTMSTRMARALGDRVHTSTPVLSITDEDGQPVVLTTSGDAVRSRAAIVTVPVALRNRIVFEPPLPSGYTALAQRFPLGAYSKVYAVYDEPFWRADGLNGQSLCDDGPCFVTFDASPLSEPEVDGAGKGILLGFVGGDYARRFDSLPPDERRVQALQCFARLFGPRALSPLGYIDQRWSAEPWIGGGPVGNPGPGALRGYGNYLSKPVRRVHWAGTETADTWTGFMDGAIRSGERAAREVIGILDSDSHASRGAEVSA